MKSIKESEFLSKDFYKKDLDILRKVYFQEILAEKRYSKHIANVSSDEIRNLLVGLFEEEKEHKEAILSEIKKINPKFKQVNDTLWEMQIQKELMNGVGNEISVIKAILQINIEKEKESIRQYIGYSKEAENEQIKALLRGFSVDEQVHFEKLQEMLNKIV
ncbi:MAG TPA: ferritin-like domain-containing protein [Candidatus Woesearchaeota archaeon]|nr:ferritin-like domain-containing protein [Candidatus Woesearchaeota archaeon]